MNNIQKNFKMKSRLRGLADGGPNMLQRGLNAVGDFGGNIGQYWSGDNARFEETNPNFGQRVGRALMPHTGFGSALGGVHDAMGRGDLLGAAGEAVGTIPGFSALRGAKTGVDAVKAVGKQVGKQVGSEAYKQAGGMSVMPTTTPKPNPEGRGPTVAEYMKMSGKDWLELLDKGLAVGAPAFASNSPARLHDRFVGGQAESPLRGLVDGGGIFTPEERARFAEQHAVQADADQAGFAQAAELAAAAPQAQQVAMPQDMVPSGGAPVPDVPDISELEPPEYELADGGLVVGKGGPTDDLVGPVALSDEEYVLPADTVKIVGRDNLDKLRLETHDFKDPEAKIAATGGLPQPVNGSALRGLADGASPNWRVDRTGTARPGVGNSLVPAGSRPMPGTSVGPAISPAPASPGAAGTPNWNVSSDGTARPSSGTSVGPARTPPNIIDGKFERVNPNQPRLGAPQVAPSAAPSAAPSTVSGGSKLRGLASKSPGALAKLGVVAGNAAGVSNSIDDVKSGYRDQFNESIGATKGLSAVPGDVYRAASRFAESLVDPMGTDWMNRVNRGIDSTIAGDGFGKGWNAPTHAPREPIFQSKYSGDLLRQLSNIGNVQSFGVADKLGNYLSTGEYAPSEGSREVFLESKANEPAPEVEETATVPQGLAPNMAPVDLDSYESKRLEQMGVAPEAQNAPVVPDSERRSVLRNTEGNIPGQMTNFGTLGGNGNIYGTATEEGGRINSFSGVGRGTRQAPQPGDPNFMGYGGGAPTTAGGSYMGGVAEWGKGTPAMSGQDASRQREEALINQRFARMENRLHNTYGEEYPGLLTKKLAELERDRSGQLQNLRESADTRYAADSSLRGSQYAADSSLRGYQERTAATAANTQLNAMYKALEAQAAAETRANAQSEKGVADMDKYIATTFDDDPAKGKAFRAFVDSADPEEIGELTQLYGGDRRRALDEMRVRMEQRDIVNDAQTWAFGRQSALHSPIVHTQNPKFLEDIASGVGAWDSAFNKLGEFTGAGAGGQVHVLKDGRRVSASKLRGDDRTQRSIRDQMALGSSGQ